MTQRRVYSKLLFPIFLRRHRLAIPHGKAFQQQIATHGRFARAQVVSHSTVSWSVAPTWRTWFMAYGQTYQRYVSG